MPNASLRQHFAVVFSVFFIGTSVAQGAFGALRGLISAEARVLSSSSSISRIGSATHGYPWGASSATGVLRYSGDLYSTIGGNSELLRTVPQNRWNTIQLEDEHLLSILRESGIEQRYNGFFSNQYFRNLFDQTASSWKKSRLSRADSLRLTLAILDMAPEIARYSQMFTLSSSGGGGIIPPKYPNLFVSSEDYNRYIPPHQERYRYEPEEEMEIPDPPDLPEEPDDSTLFVKHNDKQYDKQYGSGLSNQRISASKSDNNSRITSIYSDSNWLKLGAFLLYWMVSSIGIARIFLKAKVSRSTAYIPFLRLGQLFYICGYERRNAFSLLVPGFNLYYWWQVNVRLCKTFQYPTGMAVLGFLVPGLLWYLIGFSNKYYIGHQRFQ